MPREPPWAWRRHLPLVGVPFQPITVGPEELLILSRAQSKRRFCTRSGLLCHLGHMIQKMQWPLKYQCREG